VSSGIQQCRAVKKSQKVERSECGINTPVSFDSNLHPSIF
jgi:hypothetical protein